MKDINNLKIIERAESSDADKKNRYFCVQDPFERKRIKDISRGMINIE